MNKRKLLTLALAVCMVAILAVGGTLAYLTDTDQATNTFTVGNVAIDLNEQQRGEDGLEAYQDGKLYPIVGDAQNDLKDEHGLPTSKNYKDKIVTVTNTGSEDAWVRVYFAIPSVLDDGYDTFNAGLNVLHFNFGNYKDEEDNWKTTYGNQWIWKQENGKWNYFETTMNGIKYNVYFADYYQPLKAGVAATDTTAAVPAETTVQFIQGVYLDNSFDYNHTTKKYTAFGKELTVDTKWDWNKIECPVFAIAVQAAGFENANDAIEKSFGKQYNPWGTDCSNWQ